MGGGGCLQDSDTCHMSFDITGCKELCKGARGHDPHTLGLGSDCLGG